MKISENLNEVKDYYHLKYFGYYEWKDKFGNSINKQTFNKFNKLIYIGNCYIVKHRYKENLFEIIYDTSNRQKW